MGHYTDRGLPGPGLSTTPAGSAMWGILRSRYGPHFSELQSGDNVVMMGRDSTVLGEINNLSVHVNSLPRRDYSLSEALTDL